MTMPATMEELDCIRDECKSMVTKRAGASSLASMIPIPGTDVAADIGMLIELLPSINRKFGLSKEQLDHMDEKTRIIAMEIAKKLGNVLIGKIVTKELIMVVLKKVGTRFVTKQVLKYIPIFGQLASASISFAAMKYLGNCHVDECYEVARQLLQRSTLECQADLVANVDNDASVPSSESPLADSRIEIIQTIRQLKELYDQGIIDEEEFKRAKQEQLNKLSAL